MLRQLIQEIETARGAIRMGELSHKLGVESSALDGMIQFLVQTRRMGDSEASNKDSSAVCVSHSCGITCPGAASCPFVAKMPRTYHMKGPSL